MDDLSITGTSGIGGNVTTGGAQTYAGAATLAADAVLSSTNGGNIGFGGTLDGAHALTVATSGATTFGGAVGAVTALDSLATGSGATAIDGGSVTTTGAQTYGGNVVLGADTTLATGGALTLGGTLDAAGAGKDLTVNAGSGAVAFNGAVGAAANGALGDLMVNSSGATAFGAGVNAASLRTDAGGTTSLNGNVSTSGDQVYGDAVQVQSDLTIKTGGGDLAFAGALGQAAGQSRNLSVDAGKGSASFAGAVTLASLDIAAASGATLDNHGNAIGAIAAKLGNGGLSLDNTTGITVGIGANGITSGGAVAIHAQHGDVVLERGVSVSGISNIVLDAADGNFVNHAGAAALATASGRWQVYSTDPSADNRGGLTPDFKQYNARFGATLASGGNGFVYSIAPVITGQLVGEVRKVYDGGTSAVLAAGNYDATSGAIDGDVVTLNTPVFGSYDSKTAGSAKLVTVNGVQVLSAMDGNVAVYGYQLASNTLSGAVGVVDKAMIQIAGLVALNKVYDGTDTAYLNTQAAQATGVMAGDQISLVSATGYYVDGKNVGAGKAIVADDIKLAGADKDNYQMVPTTGLASDVTARALVVSASGGSKTYDVTTGTTVTLADNRVDGDVLDIGYQANYLDKNAGTGKYIRVSDIAISGQDAQNYTVNTSTASFGDIAKADLTVHATGVSRSYDGTTNATVVLSDDRATAAMQGDQLTLSYEAASFASKGAGLGKTISVLGVSVGGIDAGNYNVNLAPARTASADINGIHLTLSGVQALDKAYDGTTNAILDLANASLNGVVAGDSVSFLGTLGSGVFASKDAAASPIAVSVTGNGIQLTGSDADGYLLNLPTSLTASITPKALTAVFTAPGKVYDGNATAAPTVTITGGLVGNEQVTATGSASFDSKNVGTRVVTLDSTALHADAASGALASNYVLVANQTTTADITRLASVVWTGGPHGDWFDPKNWEGGAVPDFANVKDVLIPGGVTVDFDPAPNGAPVYVDSITGTGGTGGSGNGGNGGNGGTLNIGGGTLNTGGGGVNLGGFNQSGGTLTSGGNVSVDTFVQTGGTTIVEGDFSAHGGFEQGGNGTLTVGGTTTIVSDGGVVIGNLTSKGDLDVTSKGGPVTQSEGTTIVTEGDTTLTAEDEDGNPADIILANDGNDFGGPVTVNGKDVVLSDKDDLTVDGKTSGDLTTRSGGTTTLGDTKVGGDLDVTAKGPVKQADGDTLSVGGKTTLDSEGDILLGNGGNDFGGPVTVSGKDVVLGDKDDLTVDGKTSGGLTTQSGGTTTLGDTKVGGDLDVTAKGPVKQTDDGTLTVGGKTTLGSEGDITLGNKGNDFGGPVTVSGKDVVLSDENDLTVGGKTSGGLTTESGGTTTIGNTTVGGDLDVTSRGPVKQADGDILTVGGKTTLTSEGDIILGNGGNDFGGPVTVSGKDVVLGDKDDLTVDGKTSGGLTTKSGGSTTLGDTTVGGDLDVTAKGPVKQSDDGTLTIGGKTTLGSEGDITLGNKGNDFGGPVTVSGKDVVLGDKNDLTVGGKTSGGLTTQSGGTTTLGTTTVGGKLDVTSKGPVNQGSGGTLTVGGGTTLTSEGDVTLANEGNDFGGPVTVSGKDVRLSDKNDLTVDGKTSGGLTTQSGGTTTLGDTKVGGDLDVTAKGPVKQADGGTLTIGGKTTLGSEGDITLGNKGNDFGGPVTVSGKDVVLGDKNDLTVGGKTSGGLTTQSGGATTIGSTTVGGKLDVTSGGSIGQSGGSTLGVAGTSTLSSGGNVVLANAGNDFTGPVAVSGKDVSLSDSAGGLVLGKVDSTGGLVVTSTGGAIQQGNGGTIHAAGTSSFTASDKGAPADVLLNQAGNDLVGAVSVNGRNVNLVDGSGGITLGSVKTGGALLVAATGAITQAPGQYLDVAGYSTFSSGTSKVELATTGNNLRGGSNLNSVTVLTPVAPVAAMPVLGAGPQVQAVGNVAGASAASVSTVAAAAAAAAPASAGAIAAAPASVAVASGIVVRTVQIANAAQNGLISVGVPKAVGTFAFNVPAEAFANQAQGGIVVSSVALENGASLPSWLQFNVNDLSFTATSIPANGLPLRVVVSTAGKRVVVVISELEAGGK